jgi:uncharacterized glyoxalase superfamily protein PhnB
VIHNRAVPVAGVLPELYYFDAGKAIEWLSRVFGFEVHYIVPEDGGSVHTAQLRLGNAYIMVRNRRDRQPVPNEVGGCTQQLMVIVEDVDRHYAHAKAEGAELIGEPVDQIYGEREYEVIDLDGHRWMFSQHIADIDPLEMFPRA